MNEKKSITERYLNKSSKELFWLFFLVFPYLIWMYSIGIELNKRMSKQNSVNKLLLNVLTGYILIHLIFSWTTIIFGIMDIRSIMPYHIVAMISSFALMVLTTLTILKFEKEKKIKQSNGIDLFFGVWYYIFGIWNIQPKLNKYIKQEINNGIEKHNGTFQSEYKN